MPHPTARLNQPRRRVPSRRYRPNPSHLVVAAVTILLACSFAAYFALTTNTEASAVQANLAASSTQSPSTGTRTVQTFESLVASDIEPVTSSTFELLTDEPMTVTSTSAATTTTTTLPALPIAPAVDPLERFEIIVIGDSLLVGAEQDVRLSLAPAQITIDAEVGRGLPTSQQVFERAGQVVGEHDIVVIQLGTNDFNFPSGYELMIAGTLAVLDHARCIIWVNSQEFTGHLPELNDAIERQTARVEKAFVADWAAIADDPGLHQSDGYHLNEKGSSLLATLIASSVRNNCVPVEPA